MDNAYGCWWMLMDAADVLMDVYGWFWMLMNVNGC